MDALRSKAMELDFKEIFSYTSGDGKLRWKVRGPNRRMDRPAGTNFTPPFKGKNKYNRITINGKYFLTHHVIWLMHNGKITDGMDVDHKNNNSIDNRIENLQLLTRRDNSVKTPSSGRNTISGHNGIAIYKKYRVRLKNKRFNKFIGSYDTAEEACAALHAFYLKHNVLESEFITSVKRSKTNKELPIGVHELTKRYRAILIKDSVVVYRALFSTLEEAIKAHKDAFIKEHGADLYVE